MQSPPNLVIVMASNVEVPDRPLTKALDAQLAGQPDNAWQNMMRESLKPGAGQSAGDYFASRAGCAKDIVPELELFEQLNSAGRDSAVANRPTLNIGDIKPGTTMAATIKVEGRDRVVDIHVPKGYDGGKTPVLYMLSGQAGAGAARGLMEKETGMSEFADKNNFIVVYPVPESKPMAQSGLVSWLPNVDSWNAPGAGTTEYKPGSNDINYIKALNLALPGKFNIDASRVGIAGFSEGGEFAQAVAAAMPNTFASVISDNGTRFGTEGKPLQGDKTSALIIHGDHNYAFPSEGGRGLMTLQLAKVAESQPRTQKDVWIQAAGIDATQPVKSTLGDKVDVSSYADGKGVEVREMTIKGGKNAWDGGNGGQGFWDWSTLGNVQKDVPVSKYVADFFLSHPKVK